MISIFFLFIALFSTNANAASFDCNKAKTYVEQTICSNNELSLLDDELSFKYKKALAVITNKEFLKSNQRKWLAIRNTCKDVICLNTSYRNQIAYLDDVISQNSLNGYSDSQEFKINRFYQSSKDFYRVVISTTKTRRIKCILFNNQGNPIAVDTSIVTPPVDEMMIGASGVSDLVESVKCLPVE